MDATPELVFINMIRKFLKPVFMAIILFSPVAALGANFSFVEIVVFIWVWASICEEVLTPGLIQGSLVSLKHYGIKLSKIYISLPVMIAVLFF